MAIDILSAFEQEQPPQDFVIPGFLAGTVGALVAPGSTGKSFLALQIAGAVAGADSLGLGVAATGRVIYYNAEDPQDEIKRRLHSLGAVLSPDQRQEVVERLTIEPVCGSMLNILNDQHRAGIIKHSEGARLIIFDTLSRIHTAEENDNGAMAQVVAVLENIAKETGGSVLFLHHTSKAAAFNSQGDLQQAARGASSLIDNARWCGYLSKMTEQEAGKLTDRMDRQPISKDRAGFFVRFGVSKQNYGGPIGERWYEKGQGGLLKQVWLKDAKKAGGRDEL